MALSGIGKGVIGFGALLILVAIILVVVNFLVYMKKDRGQANYTSKDKDGKETTRKDAVKEADLTKEQKSAASTVKYIWIAAGVCGGFGLAMVVGGFFLKAKPSNPSKPTV